MGKKTQLRYTEMLLAISWHCRKLGTCMTAGSSQILLTAQALMSKLDRSSSQHQNAWAERHADKKEKKNLAQTLERWSQKPRWRSATLITSPNTTNIVILSHQLNYFTFVSLIGRLFFPPMAVSTSLWLFRALHRYQASLFLPFFFFFHNKIIIVIPERWECFAECITDTSLSWKNNPKKFAAVFVRLASRIWGRVKC